MRSPRFTRPLLAVALLFASGACHSNTEPDPIIGTFLATTFTVEPPGLGARNALSLGGSLGINIANNLVTAGTLIMPPSVTGGQGVVASMAGVADTAGVTVRFSQAADTFVRDLQFNLVENRLEALNQTVAGTRYTLILTRQ